MWRVESPPGCYAALSPVGRLMEANEIKRVELCLRGKKRENRMKCKEEKKNLSDGSALLTPLSCRVQRRGG